MLSCMHIKHLSQFTKVGYATGQKHCQVCEIFLNWNRLWICPCCGYRQLNQLIFFLKLESLHKINTAGGVTQPILENLCIFFCISREYLRCRLLLRYYLLLSVQMFLQHLHLFLKIPLHYLLFAAVMF